MAIKHKIKVKDKSVFRDKTISDDYKTGGAYKALLAMFAKHFKYSFICTTRLVVIADRLIFKHTFNFYFIFNGHNDL